MFKKDEIDKLIEDILEFCKEDNLLTDENVISFLDKSRLMCLGSVSTQFDVTDMFGKYGVLELEVMFWRDGKISLCSVGTDERVLEWLSLTERVREIPLIRIIKWENEVSCDLVANILSSKYEIILETESKIKQDKMLAYLNFGKLKVYNLSNIADSIIYINNLRVDSILLELTTHALAGGSLGLAGDIIKKLKDFSNNILLYIDVEYFTTNKKAIMKALKYILDMLKDDSRYEVVIKIDASQVFLDIEGYIYDEFSGYDFEVVVE